MLEEYTHQYSAKTSDPDVSITASLRAHHPSLTLTTCPESNINLVAFAAAGYAEAELDKVDEETPLRWRVYLPAANRADPGRLGDTVFFACYRYTWRSIEFTVYRCSEGYTGNVYYILTNPDSDETPTSKSKAADALLEAAGVVTYATERTILVYDGYWYGSRELFEQVQHSSWDDVILNEKMKRELQRTVVRFFNSEEQYKRLNAPWKRGLIFYGPPGNGKTISLKALMHSLSVRKRPVVSLYVKSIDYSYQMRAVFTIARQQAPCLLILEDVDALVTKDLRSYFFNEIDGLENNNGICIVATTNHLEKLDPGLAKRPSRFDRKYLFPLPDLGERIQYAEYWRGKLQANKDIDFPKVLCPKIAAITGDFSFAYLKEAFIATLLALARDDDEDEEPVVIEHSVGELECAGNMGDEEEDGIEDLPFWKEFQTQVQILREDMDSSEEVSEDVFSEGEPECLRSYMLSNSSQEGV